MRVIIINVKQGNEINIFNCTYLGTKITFYVKKSSLETNTPHISNFRCEEWFLFTNSFYVWLDNRKLNIRM
jgi:hypothetical protein